MMERTTSISSFGSLGNSSSNGSNKGRALWDDHDSDDFGSQEPISPLDVDLRFNPELRNRIAQIALEQEKKELKKRERRGWRLCSFKRFGSATSSNNNSGALAD